MAASTTVFTTSPIIGAQLSATATSTPAFAVNTLANGNDGRRYIYGKASEAIGSISTCKIGTAGSISDDSGSAGWTSNCPGGAAANQYLWIRRTSAA